MLKTVYDAYNKKKNNNFVIVIKSWLGDFKNMTIENMSEEGK